MIVAIKPVPRAIGIGVATAALLIGSFLLGSARSGAAATDTIKGGGGSGAVVLASSATGGKITVTGTGTVAGTPGQLGLSMGAQTNASSASTAPPQAHQAAPRGIHPRKAPSGGGSDIQTSGR